MPQGQTRDGSLENAWSRGSARASQILLNTAYRLHFLLFLSSESMFKPGPTSSLS